MRKHGTDAVSLTLGLVYLAVVAWWLLARLFDVTRVGVGWIVAGTLVLLGLLGLLATARSALTHDSRARR